MSCKRRQRLALHVLGHDEQRLAGLGHRLEHRQQVTDVGDLLVVQEDEGILQLAGHVLLVVDEVGREVAAVELHALDHLELVLEPRALLDRDHALLADLLHGLGDDLADGLVGVGRDGAHLGDGLAVLAGLGELLQLLDGGAHGLVDAPLEVHRVHARGHRLEALLEDALGEHRGRGRAVAGHVRGLGGDLLDHLRAHVLELVLELDLLGHRHAVLGDRGRAEALLQHHVAALGAERHLDRVGQDVDAAEHPLPRVVAELDLFRRHRFIPSMLS